MQGVALYFSGLSMSDAIPLAKEGLLQTIIDACMRLRGKKRRLRVSSRLFTDPPWTGVGANSVRFID
jgi:hypothetical protein